MEQKIVPHLWFDNNAMEAVEFYVRVFQNAKIIEQTVITDTPSGDAQIIQFQLEHVLFSALNGGPYFSFNPSMSFFVFCDSREEADRIWDKMSADGIVLMEQQDELFPFYHGWIQDKFGISWQICYEAAGERKKQKIIPCLMFSNENVWKAEELLNRYKHIFSSFVQTKVWRVPKASSEELRFSEFECLGFSLIITVADSKVDFSFNESLSFMLSCENEEEADYYWDALTFDLLAEQCGWLRDEFGISWQIIPKEFGEIMSNATPEKMELLTKAFLKMKKLDIKRLREIANQVDETDEKDS